MSALRLATVATCLMAAASHAPKADAQVLFTTGVGICKECGHSELDTQRYINSFLNQLFFPNTALRRTAIAGSLYFFTATYTIHGRRSPDPQYSSVTISITAEIQNAIPTGKYHVSAVTPGGKVHEETYPVGTARFSVRGPYQDGAVSDTSDKDVDIGGPGAGPGAHPGSAPQDTKGKTRGRGNRRPAGCSGSRVEGRGNETILYCLPD